MHSIIGISQAAVTGLLNSVDFLLSKTLLAHEWWAGNHLNIDQC